MSALYLSRARLKRQPALDALAPLLIPSEGGARAHAAHRLVWSLFAGDLEARRPFLFRETHPGGVRGGAEFMILSTRPPSAESPLLDVETQGFAPLLRKGDRLAFSLRANATVARKDASGRPTRSDVVMRALHDIAKPARSEHREKVLLEAGGNWLRKQGERYGFRLPDADEDDDLLRIDGYDVWRFSRLGERGRIAVFDCGGVLEVTDPDVFLGRLPEGFGRARSFGCGLMLIRRA